MGTSRVERDGKVAVLYSPGYGAGWSTWTEEHAEALTFDPQIVAALLADNRAEAARIAAEKYPDMYLGGLDSLKVEWIPKGTVFEIVEYDGSESINIIANQSYMVA